MKRSIYSQNSLLRISLLSALTLTASFTTHAQDKPVAGGVLTVALGSDTPIIDPSITAYSVTALVTRNVVDSLVGQAEDNSFTPWLAERWEIKNNNREYQKTPPHEPSSESIDAESTSNLSRRKPNNLATTI